MRTALLKITTLRTTLWGTALRERSGAIALATGALLIYATYSIGRHLRFETGGYDLGIFEQAIRRYAHLQVPYAELKGAGVDLLGDHFHPILILVAPVYRLLPSPITLLVVQALVLALSVYQVTRTGTRELGRLAGLAIGAGYALSWGIQAAVGYDFHEIVFAVPILAASLDAYLRGRYRACALWAAALVLVKEDLTLTIAAIGVLLFISGRRRLGVLLAAFGIAAFALIVGVIIPVLSYNGRYAYWNAAQIGSASARHLDLVHRIASALTGIAAPVSKPFGAVLLLVPVVFVALLSPVVLVAAPTVLWHLASANPAYSSMRYHYSVALMPVVFLAAIDGLRRLSAYRNGRDRFVAADPPVRSRWRNGPVPGSLVRWVPVAVLAIGLVFAVAGPVGQMLRPGWWRPTAYGTAALPALALIPHGATVAADNRMAAHLTAYDTVYWVSTGLRDATDRIIDADWVVGNVTSGHFPIGPAARQALFAALADCGYQRVYDRDGVVILHRVESTARGATLAACLTAHGG